MTNTAHGRDANMSLRGLSGNLTRELELLEVLLYKLEVEQLLLAEGRTERLHMATAELEKVLLSIQEAELGRSLEADMAAIELGLAPDASLREIAEAAPAPWDTILSEQRTSLVKLTSEIRDVTDSNRSLLAASRRATQETLMSIRDHVRTYDSHGDVVSGNVGAQFLDRNF